MINQAMKRSIESGECIDLSKCKKEGNCYIIENFIDGMDYCDAETEQWIWSIGKRRSDGVILASTSSKFYGAVGYECIWLR